MDVEMENRLLDELSLLYGHEFAEAMISIEKENSKGDFNKMVGGIRHLLVTVGGERYAQDIYSKLMKKINQ